MKTFFWILLVVFLAILGASLFGLLPASALFEVNALSLSILGAGASALGLIWIRLQTNGPDRWNPSSGHTSADLSSLLPILREIKEGVSKISMVQTSTQALSMQLRNLENTVGEKAATQALRALQDSELGSLRAKLNEQQKMIEASESAKATLEAKLNAEIANSRGLFAEVESLRAQLVRTNDAKVASDREAQRVNSELQEQIGLTRAANEKASAKEAECEGLQTEARRAFGHLAPQSLGGTDVSGAMQVFHAEAVSGDSAAVSAWSALTAFGAAQSDPSAKDFQLQIVRRLGLVLVQYWKHKGLSEKERHEQLALWARCLNEHADGRFNLFVPGLGTPIDRTRMSCATTATTVHEVLCWQVRNPAGANFSLAEVA